MGNIYLFHYKRLWAILVYFLFINKILSAYPPNYEESLELFRQKKYEESLQKIREVFDNYRTSLEFRLLAASNYLELNDIPKALAHLNYAQMDHPNSWEIVLLLSEAYIRNHQYNIALKILYTGLENFKNEKKIHNLLRYQLAKTFFSMNKYEKARQQLEYIIYNDPYNDKALFLDGVIYILQKNYELAEFRLKSILHVSNLDVDMIAKVYNNLGVIKEIYYNQMGDNSVLRDNLKKEALSYYNRAVELNTNYTVAKENLANLMK